MTLSQFSAEGKTAIVTGASRGLGVTFVPGPSVNGDRDPGGRGHPLMPGTHW